MTPKEKAKEIFDKYESLLLPAEYKIHGSFLPYLSQNIALQEVKGIQEFGNKMGIREPMMFWNSVETELKKMI